MKAHGVKIMTRTPMIKLIADDKVSDVIVKSWLYAAGRSMTFGRHVGKYLGDL